MKEIKKHAYAIVLLLMATIGIWALSLLDLSQTHIEEHIQLQSGWTVTTKDNVYKNADLQQLQFSQSKCGDEIVYSMTLPDQKLDNPILMLYTVHSAIEIFLDEESIYRYGWEYISPKRLMGYGYHFVELPENFAGHTLTIHAYVAIDNAFTNLNIPSIGNANYVVRDICMERKYGLAIDLFLVIFGVSLLFTSIVFARKYKDFFKLICVGGFSLGIALWSICSSNLIILFTYNPAVKVYVEFLALYISGIPLLLYFWDGMQAKKERWIRYGYRCILAVQIVFTVVAIVLQATNLVLLPELLPICHVILAAIAVFLITNSVLDIWNRQFAHIAVTIGIFFLLLLGVADIIVFNIQKYIVSFQVEQMDNALCIGTLFFVFAQIVDFCMEISHKFYEAARSETLEKMAYTDSLTGLFNRRRGEEEFDKLEKSEAVYGMYAFDLNNLKLINDSMGHEKGDLLLISFSRILEEAFGEKGVVCRMGGDEFLVIIPDVYEVDVQTLQQSFLQILQEKKRIEQDLEISVAYGYCQRDEYGTVNVKAIYHEADARMYEMKMKMKYMISKEE